MKPSRPEFAFALLAGLVVGGCGDFDSSLEPELDLLGRIERYESAMNAADTEAVLELLAADARWQLPTRKESLDIDMIRTSLETDEALGVRVAIEGCEPEGLVVNCRYTEQNDWLELHGLGPWKQPTVRFVFDEEGRIRVVSWIGRDEETLRELKLVSQAFEDWIKADADRSARFEPAVDPSTGKLRLGRPTGELLMAMGREWVDAGRPGLAERRAEYSRRPASEDDTTGSPEAGER